MSVRIYLGSIYEYMLVIGQSGVGVSLYFIRPTRHNLG